MVLGGLQIVWVSGMLLCIVVIVYSFLAHISISWKSVIATFVVSLVLYLLGRKFLKNKNFEIELWVFYLFLLGIGFLLIWNSIEFLIFKKIISSQRAFMMLTSGLGLLLLGQRGLRKL
jgi:hypothetical protein